MFSEFGIKKLIVKFRSKNHKIKFIKAKFNINIYKNIIKPLKTTIKTVTDCRLKIRQSSPNFTFTYVSLRRLLMQNFSPFGGLLKTTHETA